MKKKYILDTNFILRYLLKDNQSQYRKAKEFFALAKEGKALLKLENAVFMEVIYVLSSYYEAPKLEVIEIMYGLLAQYGIVSDRAALENALSIFKKHNIHIIDAFVISKSISDEHEILSFDKKLMKISCKIVKS